jgi:3-carboxy-cis,cis-muconate cycloisomerase
MATSSLDPGFTTEALANLWSNHSRVQAMVRVEAALARAQAVTGVISDVAAAEIERACDGLTVDAESLLADGWEAGSPVIGLVARLCGAVGSESAGSVHLGATTQDIVDTAAMIQVEQSLAVFTADLLDLGNSLARLADDHRRTLTIGRTFRQHALPSTFGMRCAQWVTAVAADLSAVRSVRSELPVQLGGAVGTGVGLGADPVRVAEALAEELSLRTPTMPWHTDRRPVRQSVDVCRSVADTAAKVAGDVIDLAQTEVAEVSVRAGGSSAVPGKRNPIDAVRAVAAAQVCTAMTAALRPHSLDRAAGAWHAEWAILPIVFQTAGAALEAVSRTVGSLEVDAAAMARHVPGEVSEEIYQATGTFIDRALDRWEAAKG